jgi:hypothetical protein
MEDCEYHKGLAFGLSGLDRLLELARPAMKDSHSCERLYDFARSAVLTLLRCDRGKDEIESWKEGLSRISALALGSYSPEEESRYLLRTATRFKTLADLLGDQNAWKESYDLPDVLGLPFVAETISFLKEKGPARIEDYSVAMGTQHTSVVSILAQLRLLTWHEPVKGEITIWLTPEGELLAAGLRAET